MSENKITREEMIGWFGSEMPIEAVNLVWNSPGEKTLGQIREELRAMGERHKARKKPELIEHVAQAMWQQRRRIAWGATINLPTWEEDTDALRDSVRSEARAAIEAMRELPSEPGPRYSAGEYSRRSHEAMIDDALGKTN